MNGLIERPAVILAAGFGSRLGGNLEDAIPKPMIQVLGKPVILRTLASLEKAGVKRVIIVLGFEAEQIQKKIEQQYKGPLELVFAHNDKYNLSNGLSVLCAKHYIQDQFLLTMADHVLDDGIMHLAGSHVPPEAGATLLVDYKIDKIFDMDDATKVLEKDGHIVSIGKTIEEFNCIDIGVFVCSQTLFEHLDAVYQEKGDTSLSDGIQALAKAGTMTVLDVGEGFWQDVDTPEMLAHAEVKLKETETPE